MSDAFDAIPYSELEQPFTLLGTGSFGSVYKSTYLGLPVALKQVNPSTDYDVRKYFEREWRLMREARHPNVVLYLGLSHTPAGQIYIVSEFVEGGNLRSYIYHKRKPFPWRMRISFATDIARALAYLHARKCIHRDLKPENLLLTSNGRVKITDFGFARIAPRSQDEVRRLTFCGTDAYMSPEILMGETFNISTDIFSLGVIFAEILSRTLADDHHLKRQAPVWMIDAEEIRRTANPGAPEGFIRLAVDCMKHEPGERPSMKRILEVLRECEMEVANRADGGEDIHVGTFKFATGGKKRPNMPPRIPSFGRLVNSGDLQVEDKAKGPTIDTAPERLAQEVEEDDDSDDSDDDFERALSELDIGLAKGGEDELDQGQYSTSVVRGSAHDKDATVGLGGRGNASSIITIKPDSPTSDSSSASASISRRIDRELELELDRDGDQGQGQGLPPGLSLRPDVPEPVETVSALSIDSFRTAPESGSDSSKLSVAVATIGDSHLSTPNLDEHAAATEAEAEASSTPSLDGPGPVVINPSSSFLYHRFTMIKPGTKRLPAQLSSHPPPSSTAPTRAPSNPNANPGRSPPRAGTGLRFGGVNGKRTSLVDSLNFGPFDFILGRTRRQSQSQAQPKPQSQAQAQTQGRNQPQSSRSPPPTAALAPAPATKCDLCGKRLGLGYKTILECDDCGIRVHVKCGEFAPSDCGMRLEEKQRQKQKQGQRQRQK